MEKLEKNIIEQIKFNKLQDLDYDLLINQLAVLNNKSYESIKLTVDKLISKGKIAIKSSNIKVKFKKKSKDRYVEDVPHSPYYSNQDNIDLAYQILEKKDRKISNRVKRVEGKIQSTSKGYAFLIPTDINIEDIFIPEKELNGAINNDRVVVSIVGSNGRRMEGKVIQVIERGNEKIVGVLHIVKKLAYVTPDDVKFGKDVNIPFAKLNGAKDGEKVVAKITRYYASKRNPDGEITEVLGKPNEIETEVLAIIRGYNLYERFPKKILESASTLPDMIEKSDYPNRLDYTNHITFTIDGEDTRDMDDAISLEINNKGNRVLGVHIADVGEYVTRGNIYDKEAFKRGTSVYFPNLVLPMLPKELSNGICSLNERVDRLTLSCFMEFDKDANVVSSKICESIINSKKRFTYTLVQSILKGKSSENHEIDNVIFEMNKLSKQLEKKRTIRGAIDFTIPEVQVGLDDLGNVISLNKREHNDSHKLIESFMIIANETIASYFLSKNIPFVYRIHEKPDSEKIQRLVSMTNSFGIENNIDIDNAEPKSIQELLGSIKDKPEEYILNKIALRSMKKAKYSPDCIGHYGLASPKYCHFTSPIRRYPDLTIHRIIKSYLHGELNDASKENLKSFVVASSEQSSETERVAESVERDVDDLYRVFYMSNHIGEEFDAVVSSVTNFGVFVELDNTVEGMIRIIDLPQDQYEYFEDRFLLKGYNHKYTIGDKLRVRCTRADILTREIDFELV